MTEVNDSFVQAHNFVLHSTEAGMPPSSRESSKRRLEEVLNTVEEHFDKYESSTRRVYISRLNQLRHFVRDTAQTDKSAGNDVLYQVAHSFLEHLRERAVTTHTYNNYVSFLTLIAGVAGEPVGDLKRRSVSSMQNGSRTQSETLTDIHIAACLQLARRKRCKRTELLLTLMLFSGLSLRSCLNLKFTDFTDTEDGVLVQVTNRHGSRNMNLPADLSILLAEWRREREMSRDGIDNPYVFAGKTGPLSNTAAEWSLRSIGWSLGLCLSPKVLRHTYKLGMR